MELISSCLFDAQVMHHRLSPRPHGFHYDVFLFGLDLDELDRLDSRLRFLSRNRFNLYSFHDADHLDLGEGSARANLLKFVSRNGVDPASVGKVFLVTNLRMLGYVFNPISFYFCFDRAGRPSCAVAEVGNTYGEQKAYFVPLSGAPEAGTFTCRVPKHFYVSPFMELDVEFEFRLKTPSDRLELHVDDWKEGARVLVSSLTGHRLPLTDGRLLLMTLLYPFITLKVIFLIHWNALLLWLKKIPHHGKAELPSLQRDLTHPHISIAPRSVKP